MRTSLSTVLLSNFQSFTAKSGSKTFQKCLLAAFLTLSSVGVFGQIITFDFAGLNGNEATATSNSNDANLTSSIISRGTGLTASANGDRFNATNWALTSIANAISGNKYMEFTITPNSGFQFSVSSIVIQWQRSNTGNTAIALRSSADSYGSDLDAVKAVTDNTNNQTFTYTFTQANSSSAVTYRLYSYAEAITGSGGPGDGSGNDIIVNGTVTATSSTPTITLTPTTTLSLGTTICEGYSGTGNYSVSGNNLTEDIVLKPSANIEISEDGTTWYSSTSPTDLTLAWGTGTVSATTIEVRSVTSLTPGTFTGTISHTSSGATTGTKDVSGTVISPQTPTVSIAVTTGTNPMCGSASTTFTATATNAGGGTVSYQWKLNGSDAGTNSATYTISSPVNNDQVSCVISITGGCVTATTASSSTITLTVNTVPLSPSTPTSNSPQCLATGVTVYLSGSAPIGETWYWQTSATGTDEAAVNSAATYSVTSAGTTTIYLRSKSTAGCWSAASSVTVTVNPQTAISTQPANQSVGAGNTATFSVVAVGVGLTYQWQVDKGSGFANVTVSDGTATANSFTTVAATLAMNGYKYKVIITGTCGNSTSDENATLTVTAISYAQGNYLSITGTGSYTVASSWGRCNQIGGCTGTTLGAGGWGAAGANSSPSAATTVFVQGTITLSSALGVDYSTILNGGKLIVDNQHAVKYSMTIKSGGEVVNNDRLNFSSTTSTFKIEDNGILTLNSYQDNPNTSLWNGIESFAENSNVYINYGFRTAAFFTPETIISTNTITGAKFGNLFIQPMTFNNTGHWNGLLPNGTYQLTKKSLIINNASDRNLTLNAGTSNVTIGENMTINVTALGDVATSSSGDNSLSVLGNVEKTGSGIFRLNGTGDCSFNIKGDLALSAGEFRFGGFIPSTTYSRVNLVGDLKVNSGAILVGSSNTGTDRNMFSFVGVGDGLSATTTQDINMIANNTVSYITFNVNDKAYAKIINQNLSLGTNSKFNVLTGGTLDFGFSGTTPLNLTTNGNGQTFTSGDNSILKITSPDGITKAANLGNVQVPAASRTYSQDAIFHYIGKPNATQVSINGVDQISGNGLSIDASAKNIIIELDTSNPTQDNVSFKAIGINKFTSAGSLKIIRGKVVDEVGNGFEDGTSEDGKLIMTGGRYKISRSDLQPSLGGVYDLQGGVIEFAQSTTGIQIRTGALPNLKEYYKIDVSGNNVQPSGKNLFVKQTTTITPSGKLTIPTTADNVASSVLWAKKGIIVSDPGIALFGSSAQLMQDVGAVNGGKITMQRNTKMQKMDYTYWSSPVSGQVLKNTINGDLETSSGGFSPTTPNTRIFDYVEATDLFKATTDANFVEGKGYAIRGKNAFTVAGPDTYQFLGQPTNGSSKNDANPLTIKIYKSKKSFVGGVEYEHGYNMIGNPYPSNIDFYKFYDLNKDVISAKAWFWTNVSPHLTMEGSNYNGNNYATLTLTGGVPPTSYSPFPLTGYYKPTNFIKVGQGFIIQAKADVTGATQEYTLNFNNDIRDTGIGVFYNNPNKNAGINRFWVRLRSPLDIVNTILIGHFRNATDAYDNDYDAELLTVGDDSFYTVLNNKKLQIQAVGDFNENEKFAVGTKSSQLGTYTFEIEDPEGLFANGQLVYLHDKLTGTYTNLNQENYSFQAVKGFTENRFEIVYKTNSVLASGANTKDELQVCRNGEDFIVQSGKGSIDEVELFDASGRLLQKIKGGTTKVVVDGESLVTGIYILKIKRKDELVSKKIMK